MQNKKLKVRKVFFFPLEIGNSLAYSRIICDKKLSLGLAYTHYYI